MLVVRVRRFIICHDNYTRICIPLCCSISAYIKNTNVSNVKPSVVVNTTCPPGEWGNGTLTAASYDVIVCINMTHISEWASTEVSSS